MAYKVDWCSEQMCFRDVAEELAFLYRFVTAEPCRDCARPICDVAVMCVPRANVSACSLLPVRQLKRRATSSNGADEEEFEETLNPKAKLLLSQVCVATLVGTMHAATAHPHDAHFSFLRFCGRCCSQHFDRTSFRQPNG